MNKELYIINNCINDLNEIKQALDSGIHHVIIINDLINVLINIEYLCKCFKDKERNEK